MSSKRIVVTGIGATSPLAGTAPETWAALLAGKSGATPLEQEWVERLEIPIKFAAQAAVPAADILERIETKRLDPSSQFALIAGREAWADAGSPSLTRGTHCAKRGPAAYFR
jgi:3-oxoacyl-[acyl-carrier-protein] synthase II